MFREEHLERYRPAAVNPEVNNNIKKIIKGIGDVDFPVLETEAGKNMVAATHVGRSGRRSMSHICPPLEIAHMRGSQQGAIGSGVNVKDFDPKAPCSNPDEVAQ